MTIGLVLVMISLIIIGVVYNSPNPVSELNRVITSLIDKRVPFKVIRRKVNNKAWFNENYANAFHDNKMHTVSGHWIDHTFCGRSILCIDVMFNPSMTLHFYFFRKPRRENALFTECWTCKKHIYTHLIPLLFKQQYYRQEKQKLWTKGSMK